VLHSDQILFRWDSVGDDVQFSNPGHQSKERPHGEARHRWGLGRSGDTPVGRL